METKSDYKAVHKKEMEFYSELNATCDEFIGSAIIANGVGELVIDYDKAAKRFLPVTVLNFAAITGDTPCSLKKSCLEKQKEALKLQQKIIELMIEAFTED